MLYTHHGVYMKLYISLLYILVTEYSDCGFHRTLNFINNCNLRLCEIPLFCPLALLLLTLNHAFFLMV